MKLEQKEYKKDEPDPKAFACYGIDIRFEASEEVWIRFVEGNPKSDPTIIFMKWTLQKTAERGIRVLLMFWDHATWHKSQKVRSWLHQHNQEVKERGEGTRLLAVLLPKKSPWLNPIEPRWMHAKRKVMEPGRKLSAKELGVSRSLCKWHLDFHSSFKADGELVQHQRPVMKGRTPFFRDIHVRQIEQLS